MGVTVGHSHWPYCAADDHTFSRAQFLRGAVALTGAAIGAGMLKPSLSFVRY
jgi:hypothetical protein